MMVCVNRKIFVVVFATFTHGAIMAQFPVSPDSTFIRHLDINQRIYKSHDTTWVYSGICKTLKTTIYPGQAIHLSSLNKADPRPPFLTIHGNIQYDFLYRSFADTPFYQKDFRQHSVKTSYSLLFRNIYPVQVTLLHRNSNSPYFRDITDISVQFAQRHYLKQLKENLSQQYVRSINKNYEVQLNEAEAGYKARLAKVEALQQWLASPARLQELVSERERILKTGQRNIYDTVNGLLKKQIPGIDLQTLPELPDAEALKKALSDKAKHQLTAYSDSILNKAEGWAKQKRKLITDSIQKTKTAAYIEKQKKELEKARKELKEYEKKLAGAKKSFSDSLTKIKQEIARLNDLQGIREFINQKKLDAKELPKGWQALTAIRSVGIGRSWVDYSELTVKNISLTGINIEANPGNFYVAAAAGRINYRFRDFVSKNTNRPKQSLYLIRVGIGKKEGNNFILTFYDGKRSLLNPFDVSTGASKLERVIGMSAESRIRISEHQYIIAEFAKSSFHNTGNVNAGGQELFGKVKNFKDHSNEAYSIKFSSHWPMAGTKVTGYYKKMGEHFQSFNLQPVNSVQEAYQVKLQQQLWKKKLVIDAGIRKNDFSNPFITPGISSSTVFKSLQVSLRIPKYPSITVGYAPSSQLTVLDDHRLAENQYYTLNAVLSHSYKAKQVGMVTNAMFLKFYNSSPDTGFIYYNASSFAVTQFFYLKKLQLQSGLTITDQQELRVLTLDQSVSYQLKNWLSLSGGLNYNRLANNITHWGASVGINLTINKIGTIQMNYDKNYLPGTNRNLLPVQSGRVSFYRSF
jgi:hypothetical protein